MKNPWTECWLSTKALLPAAMCSKLWKAAGLLGGDRSYSYHPFTLNSELWTHMIWSLKLCSFCHPQRCDGDGDTDHYCILSLLGFSSCYDLTFQCLKKQGKSINNLRTQDKYNLNNTVRINRSGTFTCSINTLRKREPPSAEWRLSFITHFLYSLKISNTSSSWQVHLLII